MATDTLSEQNAKTIRNVVKRLVEAEIANSWKGGGPPEDIPLVEERLRAARNLYNATLRRLAGQ